MSRSWRSASSHLPIVNHLATLVRGINDHQLSILEAPPGSGKTTVLPLALLEESTFASGKILMLQPRRIAAKSVAMRMAEMLNEAVGETVGYRVRMESKVSPRTRLEVITEGLLTRKIVADPSLEGIALIILDEFHERSLHGDIGLALARETCSVLRPDLKIVIMSATLGESLPQHLVAGAWRYAFGGTPFPVRVVYEPGNAREPIWNRVSAAVRSELTRGSGDILAFLPGALEISRTEEILKNLRGEFVTLPLYGDLPYSEQQKALTPDPNGRRKVVLATTIAETSLTIDGVTTVIDSGLHKVARGESSGSVSLVTESISRDAADQRAGRAGRTAPGTCIRLWSEQEHLTRRANREPEILRADCTAALIDLAAWGVRDPSTFSWITMPPSRTLNEGIRTLKSMKAVDAEGRITETGRTLASLGTHPRLATIALEGRRIGKVALAAGLIALIEERDIIAGSAPTANVEHRLALIDVRNPSGPARRVRDLAKRWTERIERLPAGALTKLDVPLVSETGYLLACAFPESIAKRREEGSPRYLLASGVGASLGPGDPLLKEEYLVVTSMRSGSSDSLISLAAPLSPTLFDSALSALSTTNVEVEFNAERGQLIAETVTRCGAVMLRRQPSPALGPQEMLKALSSWLSTSQGFSRLPWSEESLALRARVEWVRGQAPQLPLPSLTDDALQQSIDSWLGPFLEPGFSLRSVTPTLIYKALESYLPWNSKRDLDAIAPTTLKLPNGKVRRIEYSATEGPYFSAKVQELFGLASTPLIGSLRVPALIHLLSPASRPVQVTRDLGSFWRTSYPEVRKELRGRYPKHKWPEDPLSPLS
jgi:ATP-dependent helicase HrpB